MRRLLSELVGYLRRLGQSSLGGWSTFFFRPADPTPLGLIRLVVGLLLIWDLGVLGLDLQDFLGSDGWIGPEAARHFLAERSPWAWSIWFWVPDGMLSLAWLASLVVATLFALGIASRLTSVLAWVIAVSIVRRAPVALFGFDHLIATWTLYLAAFGASGQAVSIDRYVARLRDLRRRASRGGTLDAVGGAPRQSVAANLTLRLIQLHLALIYGSSGLSKLMGPEWWNGSAMEMIILTPEFRRFDLTWVLAYPGLINVLTHSGVFLEITYPALIWSRGVRPIVLAAVIGLHLGIDLVLGLTEFGLAMIAANLAFVSGPWLRSLVSGREQPSGTLVYAGISGRCRNLAAFVLAADPDRVVRAVDASSPTAPPLPDARRPIALALADGRVVPGIDGALLALRWTPLFGWIARLPGVRFLARRRFDDLATGSTSENDREDATRGRNPTPTNTGSPAPVKVVAAEPANPKSRTSRRISRTR